MIKATTLKDIKTYLIIIIFQRTHCILMKLGNEKKRGFYKPTNFFYIVVSKV